MASRVRVVLNRRGIADLLQSPGIQDDLRSRAERMAEAAQATSGGPYPLVVAKSDDTDPRSRAAVVVFGASSERAVSSATTLLLASLDAAR